MAEITARPREALGTRHAKRLRAEGRIPASIQGEGRANVDVSIEEREFMTARRHHEHLFDLQVEGGGVETALVNELQWDTTAERILHVEFRRVVRDRMTEAEVELEFVGNAKGGVVNHLVHHVAIRSLPANIPDSIEVRVDDLEPGDHLTAADLVLPEGVELAEDPATAIVSVTVPRGLEEPVPAGGEPSEEAPVAADEGEEPEPEPEE